MSPGKSVYFLSVLLFWHSLKHLGNIEITSMGQKRPFYCDILHFYTYAYPDTPTDSFNNKFYEYLISMYYFPGKLLRGGKYSGEQKKKKTLFAIYPH